MSKSCKIDFIPINPYCASYHNGSFTGGVLAQIQEREMEQIRYNICLHIIKEYLNERT